MNIVRIRLPSVLNCFTSFFFIVLYYDVGFFFNPPLLLNTQAILETEYYIHFSVNIKMLKHCNPAVYYPML